MVEWLKISLILLTSDPNNLSNHIASDAPLLKSGVVQLNIILLAATHPRLKKHDLLGQLGKAVAT